MSVGLPQAQLSRRYRFSASHRLHISHFSAEQNRDMFGKCNNPYGHGHNYTVQITMAGPVDAATGMVVNLADLDSFVREHLVERFHLTNLNEDPAFRNCVPSTENLAEVLWRSMQPFVAEHAPVQLRRIRVEETNNNAFDYFGEGTPVPFAA